jgi:uncharacterized delta-60 repeat protein
MTMCGTYDEHGRRMMRRRIVAVLAAMTALVVAGGSAMAATSVPSPDVTFGAAGVRHLGFQHNQVWFKAVAGTSAGTYVAGNTTINGISRGLVQRLTSTGALDTTFGNGGTLLVPGPKTWTGITGAVAAPDGSVDFVGFNNGRLLTARLTKAGKWLKNGIITTGMRLADTYQWPALDAKGRLVVAADTKSRPRGIDWTMVRFWPDGSIDHGFGPYGKVTGSFAPRDTVTGLTVDASGRTLLATSSWSKAQPKLPSYVTRFTTAGRTDPSFSGDGRVPMKLSNGIAGTAPVSVSALPGGQVLVGLTGVTNGQVGEMQFLDNGTPDPAFGGGDGFYRTTCGVSCTVSGLETDQGLVMFGGIDATKNGFQHSLLIRFAPDGSGLDPSFAAAHGGIWRHDYMTGGEGLLAGTLDASGRFVGVGDNWRTLTGPVTAGFAVRVNLG